MPGSQPQAMNAGGGARGCCPRLQRSTVPGSDPQRCNELLLLAAGDEAALEPRHHVLYFPGDVQVTRGPGLPDTPTRVVTREAGGVCWGGGEGTYGGRGLSVGPGAAGVGGRRGVAGSGTRSLSSSLSGTTVCVLGTGHCWENAFSLKYSR